MKTGGLHIELARYLLQQDTRRWQVSVGMQQRLEENLRLQAEPSYAKQQDQRQGDYHGYRCSILLNKTF